MRLRSNARRLIWGLAGVLIGPACLAADPVESPRRLVADRNAFALKLLDALARDAGSGNTVLSPHGVVRVLEMAAAGAAGPTADEIRRVVGIPSPDAATETIDPARPVTRFFLDARVGPNGGYGVKVEEVKAGSAAARGGLETGDLIFAVDGRVVRAADRLRAALEGSAGAARFQTYSFRNGKVTDRALELASADGPKVLTVRDAAFVQRSLAIRPEFRSDLERRFGARIVPVDFTSDPAAARAEIERWARPAGSSGPLDLAPVTTRTRLVLADTVAFESEWSDPFDPPTPGRFTRAEGPATDVPMLKRTGRYKCDVRADRSVLLELPYADGAFAMLAALPAPGAGTRDLIASWKTEENAPALDRLRPRKVEVWLPEFRVEANLQLNKALAALGMPRAFGGDADFSGVALLKPDEGRLVLAAVTQSTYLQVTPRGTRAGAVTTATVALALGVEDEPLAVHLDRPFVFLVLDRRTNLIVFAGCLNEPAPVGARPRPARE